MMIIWKCGNESEKKTVIVSFKLIVINNSLYNSHAISFFGKDLIFLLKDQTYAWHELGNIVKYNDKELAISMFCKALSLKNDKNMTINIH